MTEPKIRFKRDDGSSFPDWEEIKLGELTYPTGVKNKNNVDLESYSISNEKGFIPQSEQFEGAGYLNDADRTLYYIVSTGSFAYNPARINVGSIGYQNVGKDVLVSSLYEIFNTRDNLNDDYLMNWFKTGYFHKNVMKYSEGGVRQYFYYDKLCMVDFALPSLPEQQKIADFLNNVDEVIVASEEEVANLEQQKKAIMQKIFSQEVRFKKEDGSDFPDWEQITFDSLYEPLNNNTYSRDCLNYESGEAKNIHYGDILVKFGEICDVQKEELPFVNDGNSIQKYASLQDGDIILADTAEDETVGKAIELYNVNGDKVISGLHTMVCRPRLTFAPKYLGYYMNSSSYHSQLKPYMQGIKVTSIGRKNIAETMISYPADEREQQLIADFLTSYDEAITAAKQELEKWKELKKGLLQQMFV